jgi:hypothetical protein
MPSFIMSKDGPISAATSESPARLVVALPLKLATPLVKGNFVRDLLELPKHRKHARPRDRLIGPFIERPP